MLSYMRENKIFLWNWIQEGWRCAVAATAAAPLSRLLCCVFNPNKYIIQQYHCLQCGVFANDDNVVCAVFLSISVSFFPSTSLSIFLQFSCPDFHFVAFFIACSVIYEGLKTRTHTNDWLYIYTQTYLDIYCTTHCSRRTT